MRIDRLLRTRNRGTSERSEKGSRLRISARKAAHVARYARGFKYAVVAMGVAAIGWSLVMLGGWAGGKIDVFFKIRTVQIMGQFDNDQANAVESKLLPYVSKNLFMTDLHEAQQSLLQLSWVRSTTLRKRWPDTIQVMLVEQLPVARWNAGAYLNDAADIFVHEHMDAEYGLPELYGPGQRAREVLMFYSAIESAMAAAGLDVQRLSMNDRGAWVLMTRTGVEMKLGVHNPEQRVFRFLDAYRNGFAASMINVKSVDLRHSNGFSVQWRVQPEATVYDGMTRTLQKEYHDV